ncbi:MAG: hypothetical protein LC672_01980, partial [Acidobacteria bacterium]|nr:hypothetical protein [Acidobacteriota bacterium]
AQSRAAKMRRVKTLFSAVLGASLCASAVNCPMYTLNDRRWVKTLGYAEKGGRHHMVSGDVRRFVYLLGNGRAD